MKATSSRTVLKMGRQQVDSLGARDVLRRSAVAASVGGEFDVVPPIVREVLAAPGRMLDEGSRAEMEGRFGNDFRDVRVYTDGGAAESAEAVGAKAYTVGNRVAFGEDRYAPQTTEGKRLLAHELTHVVQQTQDDLPASGFGAEAEATRAAAQVAASGAATVRTAAPVALQKEELSEEDRKRLAAAPCPNCHSSQPSSRIGLSSFEGLSRETLQAYAAPVDPVLLFQRELDRALGQQQAEDNLRRLQVQVPAPLVPGALVGEALGGEKVLVPLAEGAAVVVEFAVRSVPVISTAINVYEAAAGRDVFSGRKLTDGERVAAGVFAAIDLIPVAGRLLHAGASGARALVVAAKGAGGVVTARRSFQVLRGLSVVSKEEELLLREAATLAREGKPLGASHTQTLERLEEGLAGSAERRLEEGAAGQATRAPSEGRGGRAQGTPLSPSSEAVGQKAIQSVFKDIEGATVLKQDVIDDIIFTRYSRPGSQGELIVEEARGYLRLTEEGTSAKAHKAIRGKVNRQSGGMAGDHAGHKIAASLGGPAAIENLARQNSVANATGTWRQLEERWTSLLKSGEATAIEVRVSDTFKAGVKRPFRRDVQAIETLADGTKRTLNLGEEGGTLIFGNFPSRPKGK